MTEAELVEFGGYLFVAWISGYSIGFLICHFRKFMEKI